MSVAHNLSVSPSAGSGAKKENELQTSDEAVAPPATGSNNANDTPEDAAARHGYKLDQRADVAGGVRLVMHYIGATIIVAIHPDTQHCVGRYLDTTTENDVSAWSIKKNDAGYNLYFGPNQPKPGLNKKARKDDIAQLRAWGYADIDAKDGRSHDQAIASISVMPQPNIIIATGGGYQPVWLLPEPIPATGDAIMRVEALGKQIACITGGDAVENIDRILRLPFSRNFPNAKKRKSGRIECLSGLLTVEAFI
jgi:hypothetical protein